MVLMLKAAFWQCTLSSSHTLRPQLSLPLSEIAYWHTEDRISLPHLRYHLILSWCLRYSDYSIFRPVVKFEFQRFRVLRTCLNFTFHTAGKQINPQKVSIWIGFCLVVLPRFQCRLLTKQHWNWKGSNRIVVKEIWQNLKNITRDLRWIEWTAQIPVTSRLVRWHTKFNATEKKKTGSIQRSLNERMTLCHIL